MADNKRSTSDKAKEIKLKWDGLVDTPTLYANQLLISHTAGEFYLVFGEFMAAGIDLDNLPDEARIKPLVKVAINPIAMLRMAEVIKDNVDKFREKVEKGFIESDDTP